MITVQEMMSENPKTLSRYSSLYDARKMMFDNGFRHIPIVGDNNQLIGLVTQRTVLSNGVSSQQFIQSEELSKIESGTLIADIMTTNLITVTADMKIAHAAHLIHRKKIGCLPVVNRNNELIGIITDHDFVAISIQLMDMMDDGEPMEEIDY